MTLNEKINKIKMDIIHSRYYGIALLLLLTLFFWGIFRILAPESFGSLDKMIFYLQASIIYSVGACGFYFIIIMGLFDFSIGANVILSSIVGVILSVQFGYFGLLFGCILTGILIGFTNGFLYVKLKIPSMIVTVGLTLLYESVAYFVAQGEKQSLANELQGFGRAPGNLILALILFFLAYSILKYTKVGTYCHAIGNNEKMAESMGVNINKYKIIGFIILHFFVGVMAILSVSYGTSVTAVTGLGSIARNFTPLMVCFFGVAFRAYCSPIIAIVMGGFIMTLIFNGFIALGAPTTIQNFITGTALLIIVAFAVKSAKGEVVK